MTPLGPAGDDDAGDDDGGSRGCFISPRVAPGRSPSAPEGREAFPARARVASIGVVATTSSGGSAMPKRARATAASARATACFTVSRRSTARHSARVLTSSRRARRSADAVASRLSVDSEAKAAARRGAALAKGTAGDVDATAPSGVAVGNAGVPRDVPENASNPGNAFRGAVFPPSPAEAPAASRRVRPGTEPVEPEPSVIGIAGPTTPRARSRSGAAGECLSQYARWLVLCPSLART